MSELKANEQNHRSTPVRAWLTGNHRHKTIFAALIAVLCAFTSYFYLMTSDNINEIYASETRSAVLNMKKAFLKDTVDNLIREIETDRIMETEHYKNMVDQRYQVYQTSRLDRNNFVQSLIADFQQNPGQESSEPKWTAIMWEDDGEVLYDPDNLFRDNIAATIERIKPLMSHYRIISYKGVSCLFGFSQKYVDDRTKEAAAVKIRSLKFGSDSYVWVNEVLNYNGGKDYAIRRVHPNLPETEGMYLSTDMTDIKGNHPYLTELEGVKRSGEIYFRYYFKELNSDNVSEKFSFAKLYQRYDWIIAMGIQNNEIENLITQTSEKGKAMALSKTMELLVILIILMISGYTLIILIEGWRHKHNKEQLELELQVDSLTNAKSRRFGTSYLEETFRAYQSREVKPTIAIMLFDVDDFKEINDRYGHSEGDRILQELVTVVYQVIRGSDELFRLGGDEFVGIFHVANEENTIYLMEKILKAASHIKLKQDNEAVTIPVSISIGASHFRVDDTEYSDALKRADEAMYLSKSAGGNQVTVL